MGLGQILSQSLSRNEYRVAPAMRSSVSHSPASLSKNLNRLLSAAIVSPRFCCLLLSNPVAALAAGYSGESFQLTPVEYAAVTSLRVGTVRDFAAQLLHALQCASGDTALYDTETQADLHFAEIPTQSPDNTGEQPALLSYRQEADNSHSRHAAPARLARCSVAASERYRDVRSAQRHGS